MQQMVQPTCQLNMFKHITNDYDTNATTFYNILIRACCVCVTACASIHFYLELIFPCDRLY